MYKESYTQEKWFLCDYVGVPCRDESYLINFDSHLY